jgi:serine/threonine protein kinase
VSRAAAEVGSTENSYQILAKLASGGMAEIFLARGEGVAGVERYCVLKRILRDRASDVQFVQMFLDEARLAAQLQHPNIAQVYDIGKLGDSYFFTMEYVHGETVRALLHRAVELRRKLPISCVLTIVAGAAAGLHHAHVRVGIDGRALGIVHRDVSPSNLMASYEGGVKLVDFGVAKASDRAHETKSGTVKGKISYLSPEQCRGKRVDRRSDLFSLGICFWEMLTAERLYRRASDFENMNAIVSEPPPPPSSRRVDIPPEIDELVLRLLAKDPEARCQTADEVVETLEALAAGIGSVLSASALGRLVRELFGPRREPWLELEGLQPHAEGVTVTGEPIPRELAIPLADRLDHQLASVLDLSAPRQVTESLEAVPVPRYTPTTHLGKPVKRGFPLAAPPPTHPGIDPAPRAGSAPASPLADPVTSSSGVALPAPPEGPAPPPASASASFIASAPAEPQVTASGPFATLPGPHATASPGPTGPHRTAWPLYAVITGAAVVGSVAMLLVMRSGSGAVTGAASEPRSVAAPAVTAPKRPPEVPIVEAIDPEPGGSAEPPAHHDPGGAGAAPPASSPAAEPGPPIKPETAAPAPVAASVVPRDSSPAHGPALSAPKAAPRVPRGPSGSPALRAPDARDRLGEEIERLYHDRRYDQVVVQCGKGAIGAELAPKCFLAACYVGDEAAARRRVAEVPAPRLEQLVTDCKQLGVFIERADCEADPMACQR